MKYLSVFIIILLFAAAGFFSLKKFWPVINRTGTVPVKETLASLNPLSIEAMRAKEYPGSDLHIEETLEDGSNYHRYIVSYKSDGLKILSLLTVPEGEKPVSGWPVIVFNHGYIPPEVYRTTERYLAYTDAFSRNGYILIKPDYRGNGLSEGKPEGAYYSPAYATDVLNAIASVKKWKNADPDRIGLWGHSLGGNITLRDLVVKPQWVKAAVIWGGVVGSYDDLMNRWRRDRPFVPSQREAATRGRQRSEFVKKFGVPSSNPGFWQSIDPTYFLKDVTAPVQLHSGSSDEEVPYEFSQSLYEKLKKAGKTAEFYLYEGSDHNISAGFNLAMQRSVEFFDRYLKN